MLEQAKETGLPDEDADEDELSHAPLDHEDSMHEEEADNGLETLQNASLSKNLLAINHVAQLGPSISSARQYADGLPSPAQSKFVAEKFESVSQELFDLRLDHESTLNDLDLMTAKYQETLRILARMQSNHDGDAERISCAS